MRFCFFNGHQSQKGDIKEDPSALLELLDGFNNNYCSPPMLWTG